MDLVVTLLGPLVFLVFLVVVTEMVVFWPVTVSAPQSSSSL